MFVGKRGVRVKFDPFWVACCFVNVFSTKVISRGDSWWAMVSIAPTNVCYCCATRYAGGYYSVIPLGFGGCVLSVFKKIKIWFQ